MSFRSYYLYVCSRFSRLSVKRSRPMSYQVSQHANTRTDPDWDKAVKEAEKIVGYSTSFANLRWLLSDEVANVALHLKKLIGTDHPILYTAKDLLHSGKRESQAWGLLILLLSKAAGNKTENIKIEEEYEGILTNQRIFAEITEIIKTGHQVHKGLINLKEGEYELNKQDMVFGNKIALLTGDYLLAKANSMISNLRNSHISEIISSALRDLTEGEFVGERNSQNFPLPSKPLKSENESSIIIRDEKISSLIGPERKFNSLNIDDCIGSPTKEWTMRNMLSGASLLGRGCEGALHLAGHKQSMQDIGYEFGSQVALTWQAFQDLNCFLGEGSDEPFSLVSAPVLYALEYNPSLYEEMGEFKGTINYNALRIAVKNGPALEKSMSLLNEFTKLAIGTLENFPNNDATNALKNIVSCHSIYS